MYSVKSGYSVAFNDAKTDLIFEVEMQPSLNVLKAQVWSLNTAPKSKHFYGMLSRLLRG